MTSTFTENEALNLKKYKALKDEVKKLIGSHLIREATYPKSVSNPILIKKHNGKLREYALTSPISIKLVPRTIFHSC